MGTTSSPQVPVGEFSDTEFTFTAQKDFLPAPFILSRAKFPVHSKAKVTMFAAFLPYYFSISNGSVLSGYLNADTEMQCLASPGPPQGLPK